jgi:acyl carrier protein
VREEGPVPPREALELEIKELIIEALTLEDLTPAGIDADAPLFNEGLGLDSLDSLDLALALEERYGVQGSEEPQENARRFASVRTLAAFVAAHRVR